MSKWMKTCHTNSKTYLVILVQYLGVSENLRLDNERPWKEINVVDFGEKNQSIRAIYKLGSSDSNAYSSWRQFDD